jgi:hypothetical protein
MTEAEFLERLHQAIFAYEVRLQRIEGRLNWPDKLSVAIEAGRSVGFSHDSNAPADEDKVLAAIMKLSDPTPVSCSGFVEVMAIVKRAWQYFENKQKEDEIARLRPSQIA